MRPSPPPSTRAEVARVREHLAGALELLRSRDLSPLTAAQRTNRARMISILRDYRAVGRFPRNEDYPGQRVPYFRDGRGVLCAVGFLLAIAGRTDIVDHVAGTRNNAYVAELVDEPGLAEWLEENGLTVAEAARIQPAYGGEDRVSTGFGIASGVGIAISVVSGLVSAKLVGSAVDRRLPGAIALLAGVGTAYLGSTRVDRGGRTGTLGAVDVVVGGLAALSGIIGLAAKPAPRIEGRAVSLTVEPVVLAQGRPGGGVAVSIRF